MLNLEARELARLCKRRFYFLKRAKSDGNGDPRPFFRSEEAVATHVLDTGPKLSHEPFPTRFGCSPLPPWRNSAARRLRKRCQSAACCSLTAASTGADA